MQRQRGGGTHGPAAWALFCALLAFQKGEKDRQPFPEVDPYTRAEPAALAQAGYASLGPFRWGDDHTTEQIENALDGVPLLWVATLHFKLGSSLPEYSIAKDRREPDKIQAELERLAKRLPRIERTATLDPWLRLHLFAQRLEDLHASFCAQFGLSEAAFGTPDKPGGELGPGPYLGMRDKFTVLLVQESSALDRYGRSFLGHAEKNGTVHYFQTLDGLFLGLAAEPLGELEALDTALHYALVYSMVLNFEAGFRGLNHPGPMWWRHGLARWFARDVDPSLLLFATPEGETLRPEEDSYWAMKVRARVENGAFPPTAEMLDWGEAWDWNFPDHMIAWSRVDYLMSRSDGMARRFLVRLHEPVSWDGKRNERIQAQVHDALEATTGLTPQAFDEAWCKYVKSKYPRR